MTFRALLSGHFLLLALAGTALAAEAPNFSVEADGPQARVCLLYPAKLPPRPASAYQGFIEVAGIRHFGISAVGEKLCLTGLPFGREVEVLLRRGLPGPAGALKEDQRKTVSIPDRNAGLRFSGPTYVLPAVGARGLPVKTVNLNEAKLTLLRVGERKITDLVQASAFLGDMPSWTRDWIARDLGEVVWRGRLAIASAKRNEEVTTLFPLAELLPDDRPGVYHLSWDDDAEGTGQWVLLSDLGIASFKGREALDVFVNSLWSGKPKPGARVKLLARNNEILGSFESDAEGHARIPGALLQGRDGLAVAALFAETDAGDFNFLNVTQPAFDFTDRGVGGRPQPGPLDAFLYAERGIYRPGETANVTVLLRDALGHAAEGQPLTLRLIRPDGVEARRLTATSGPGGAFAQSFAFDTASRTGQWTVEALVDPAAPPVGSVSFRLDDFVPPRIEVALETEESFAAYGGPGNPLAHAALKADFFYGAPGAGLRAELEYVIAAAQTPFPELAGYRFGLAEEELPTTWATLDLGETDGKGRASGEVRISEVPASSHPLEVRLRGTVFEEGGRPVNQRKSLPLNEARPFVGLKPLFKDDRLDYGETASFEVLLVDGRGQPLARPRLDWRLVREVSDYDWYYTDGRWRFHRSWYDEEARRGELALTQAGAPQRLDLASDWGWYRLEVSDPESGAVSSLRFSYGWDGGSGGESAPDRIELSLDREGYSPGETARVSLNAPFDGELLLTVMDSEVLRYERHQVSAGPSVFEIEVPERAAGVYVGATAFRPLTEQDRSASDAQPPQGSPRAVGLAWLPIERPETRLSVSLEPPAEALPLTRLELPVKVAGAKGAAFVTLAAVDEAVLRLTGYTSPDPFAHFNGKRDLGVELLDLYGRLIDARDGTPGAIRSGGDEAAEEAGNLSVRSSKVASLFSGIVALDESGRAVIPLDLPDFDGRLRLMAVAFGAKGTGSASASLTLARPLIADILLPRFLAPGDRARLRVSLANLKAPAGNYEAELFAEGAVRLLGEPKATLDLEPGARGVLDFEVEARIMGLGKIRLALAGPEGFALERSAEIESRPTQLFTRQVETVALAPGESYDLPVKALEGFVKGRRNFTLVAGHMPPLDIVSLLDSLDRYPYGCLEQTTSRALPLVYLPQVERMLARSSDDAEAVHRQVEKAIARVLSMQRHDGSFGLWGPQYRTEEWLTSYALDFLWRAAAAGYGVDEARLEWGFRWLETYARASYDLRRLPAQAYAHYVLARAGRALPDQLRAFHDGYRGRYWTALAAAQSARALEMIGDEARAGEAWEKAYAPTGEVFAKHYEHYGSRVRDAAGLLAMAAESTQFHARLPELAAEVQREMLTGTLSTQDEAWLLLSAAAQLQGEPPALARGGEMLAPEGGLVSLRLGPQSLAQGQRLTNRGEAPVYITATAAGVPALQLPPESQGVTLERRFYDRSGREVKPQRVRQGDLLIVRLSGTVEVKGYAPRLLLVDLLPAGFEIENAYVGAAARVDDVPWLEDLTRPVYREERDDRFLVALDIDRYAHDDRGSRFDVAYLVRAVTPGRFALPAPTIEDMYAPQIFARGSSGSVEVAARER